MAMDEIQEAQLKAAKSFSEATEGLKFENERQAKLSFMEEAGLTKEMEDIFTKGDVLLDCLPGSLAPKMARYAKDFKMHYVNLTEYVAETNEIIALAKNAETGFVLQSGLAPGYINLNFAKSIR